MKSTNIRISLFTLALVVIVGGAYVSRPAVTDSIPVKPTIVLVHGAFADGSAWQEVIPLLQREGFNVVAVQNPLKSLAEDVETTRRVVDAQNAPVVLVGHSYGGAVITGAAASNANVKALVYIAAFAPDVGEPVGAFLRKYPSPLVSSLVPDEGGFVYIDPAKYREVFAGDLRRRQTRVLAVSQRPIFSTVLAQSPLGAAWRTIPSWYVVAAEDHALNPDLERFYARRMNARTTEIESSHVPFLSKPKKVVAVIEQAANSVTR